MELSKQDRMLALVASKSPDQSVLEFCTDHQIRPACFYYWQKKHRQQEPALEEAAFSPVELDALSGVPVATVRLTGGALVTLYDAAAFSYLGPLL
jgi:hypothetical protein